MTEGNGKLDPFFSHRDNEANKEEINGKEISIAEEFIMLRGVLFLNGSHYLSQSSQHNVIGKLVGRASRIRERVCSCPCIGHKLSNTRSSSYKNNPAVHPWAVFLTQKAPPFMVNFHGEP